MNKDTSSGRVSPYLLLIILVAFGITLVGLAFTAGPAQETKIIGEGRQEASAPMLAVSVVYNNATPLRLNFLSAVPAMVIDGTSAATALPIWQNVALLPGPAADGSNQLRLYDAGSSLLPSDLAPHNVATQNGFARNGNWHARIDMDGQVWTWTETDGDTESDNDAKNRSESAKVQGLPPISTLALGGGHAVGLTQDGEVWTWEIAPGAYPSGAAPPGQTVKLSGLPEIVSIGAWREYGFAKSGDGAIWLWQGIENRYAALTDEELAAAIGILTGNTQPQNTAQSSATPQPSTPVSLAFAAMTQASATMPATLPTSNLRLWLKADAGVVKDTTGNISQWQDQSGKNNHASQGTAGARPLVAAAATPGGLPAVRFDGVGTHMSFGNLYTVSSGAGSAEVFAVLQSQGNATGRYAFALSHHGGLKYPASEGVLSDDFGRLVNPVSLGVPDGVSLNDWHIYNATNGGAAKSWVARLDGAVIGRADSNGNPYWYPWSYLGKSAAYSNSFWAGEIAEVLVYDRALSTEEREEVERYLRSRHGFGVPPVPATPAPPTADILDATRALVGWAAPLQPASCELQRRALSSGTWQDVIIDGRQSLLDEGLVPGATYAYRLRARNVSGMSVWSGETAITMPAAGTQGVPFDGLRLWLHPASTDGNGGAVQTWSDWSGRKTHATAANAAARPQRINDALGGRSVVRFDGSTNQLGFPTSAFSGSREMEQYVVLKAKSGAPAGRQAYALGHYGAAVQYPATDGTIRDNLGKLSGSPEIISFPAGTDAYGWHLYHTRITAQSRLARVDGRLAWQGSGLDSIYTYPWSYLGKVGSNAWAGDIAEVFVYERSLTVDEHAAVQNYLARKYGLPAPAAPEPVAAPLGITATLAAPDTIIVAWNAAPEAGVSYELQVRTPGRDYRTVAVLPAGTTSHTHVDLNPETAYTYRVRTRAPLGISAWSSETTTITPTLPPPANGQPPPTGLRLWLRADAGITLDDQGMIAHWADQSGRGNHAGQMPGEDYWMWSGLYPDTDSQIGAVVRSDYGDGLSLPAILNEATGGEIYIVLKAGDSYESVTPFTLGHAFYYPQWRDYYYDPEEPGSGLDVISDSFGRSGAVDMTVPAEKPVRQHWRLYQVKASADNWSARLDGELIGEAGGGPLVFGGYGQIGGGMGGNTAIAEILVYQRALGEEERNVVTAYLGQKYQIDVVLPPELQPPAAPANFDAHPAGQRTIRLTWSPSATEGAAYELERKAGNGSFAKIAAIASGVVEYTDTGLASATAYTYRLRAVKEGLYSGYAEANATTDNPQPITSNLRLWLKADAGVVKDTTGNISQWQDQSGKNNHASQGTAGARPLAVTAVTPGGLPAVRFDGVGTHISFGNLYTVSSGAGSAEVFAVLRSQGNATGRYAFALSHHGGLKYPASEGVLSDDFGRLVNPVSLGVPDGVSLNDWHIYNATNGGTAKSWVARLDGAVIGRADSNGNPYWYPWSYLGKSAAYSNSFWAGDIAEVLVYDRALSTEEREEVEHYLRSRHGFGAPPLPTTPAPPTVDILDATRALVGWAAPQQPASCELQRREVSGGTWQDIAIDGRPSLLDEGLVPGGAYAYRLRARNVSGMSGWSGETAVTMPAAGTQGVPFDGLRLWLHPSGADGNGGAVQTWSDWSGRKTHATAANAAARPQLVGNALGSRSAVRFDGSTSQLGFPTSAFGGSREMEQYVVLKAKSGAPAGRQAYALGHYGAAVQYPATDGTIRDNLGKLSGSPEIIPFPAGADAYGWHLYHTRITAQSRLARVDGRLAWQGSGLDSIYTYPWSYLGKVGSNTWAGDIAEVFVYERALTVDEHAAVQNYLARKYGLPTPAAPEPVGAPAGITATLAAPDTIIVGWNAASEAGASYELQVRTPGRDYRTVAVLPAGTTSHTHVDLNPETAYTYRVRTRAPLGISAWSIEATALTPALPPPANGQPPPTGLRLWLRADAGITLDDQGMIAHWADQSGRGNHAGQMPGEDYWMWSGLYPEIDSQIGAVVRSDYGDGLSLPAILNEATGGEIYLVIKAGNSYESVTPFTLGHSFYYPQWKDYYYDPEEPGSDTDVISDSFGRSGAVDMTAPAEKPVRQHWRLYQVRASADNWSARLDGELIGEAGGGPLVFGGYGQIGGGMGGNTAIAEILVYQRALGEEERNVVTAYLGQKYQLDVVPPEAQPPAAPANLEAHPAGQNGISLSWTPSATPNATYELERKNGDAGSIAPYAKIAGLAANTVSYNDTGLIADAIYTYRLRATKDGIASTYTAEASATTLEAPPGTPGNPAITTVTGTSITLVWTGPTDDTITYDIERGTDGVGFAKIAEVTGALTHTDIGLTPETTYHYRIRACNNGGASAYTVTLTATTTPLPQPPAAPSSLTATATGQAAIFLAWTASPAEGASYEIERRLSSETAGAFAQIAALPPGVTSHTDEALAAGTSYVYRVRAVLGNLHSDYSNEAEATTQRAPVPPAIRIIAPVSGGTIAWNEDLTITAEVDEGDSEIIRVEFYRNGILFGTANEVPYSLDLSNVQPGEWVLSARAIADDGASAWSEGILLAVSAKSAGASDATLSPSYGASVTELPAAVSVIAPALRTQAVWQGKVTAVAEHSVLLDMGTSAQIDLPSGKPYYLEVVGTLADGAVQTGRVFDIASIENGLAVCRAAVTGKIRPGDIVAIREHTTLGSLFTSTDNGLGADDRISFNVAEAQGNQPPVIGAIGHFVHQLGDAGGWTRHPDDASVSSLAVIYPDRAVIVDRTANPSAGPLVFAQAGTVRAWEAVSQPMLRGVPQNLTSANVAPLPLKHYPWHTGSAGTGLIGANSIGDADLLVVGTGDATRTYWFRTDDEPPGWRLDDDPQTDRGGDSVQPGSLMKIESRAGEPEPAGADVFEVALPRGN